MPPLYMPHMPCMRQVIIGDFPEHTARAFLTTSALPSSHSKDAVSDEDWRLIYSACGGNAGLLQMVASKYQVLGSWHTGEGASAWCCDRTRCCPLVTCMSLVLQLWKK